MHPFRRARRFRKIVSIDVDVAIAQRRSAGDGVQQGGLARTVWTDQRDEFTVCDGQIDAVEHMDVAVCHAHIGGTKQPCHARGPATRVARARRTSGHAEVAPAHAIQNNATTPWRSSAVPIAINISAHRVAISG